MNRACQIIKVFFLSVGVLGFVLHSMSAFAAKPSDEDLDKMAANGIIWYNPNGEDFVGSDSDLAETNNGGCSYHVSEVSGDTNEERIWNFLVRAGISGVSDNAAVLSGIMGNIKSESGYDPFVYNTYGYYGLYQTERDAVMSAMNKAGVSTAYFHLGNESSAAPQEVQDQAIIAQLNQLLSNPRFMKNEYSFVKNLDIVTNKTGAEGAASYAELFQVTVERGVDVHGKWSGSGMLTDSKVQAFANAMYSKSPQFQNVKYQGMAGRLANAKDVYARFNGKAGGEEVGDSGSLGSDRDKCTADVDDIQRGFEEYAPTLGPGSPGKYNTECPSLVRWFINNRTTLTYGGGNGAEVVRNLINANSSLLRPADAPIAPAVFSVAGNVKAWGSSGTRWEGHTGLVVAVNGNTATIVDTWDGIDTNGGGSNGYTYTRVSEQPWPMSGVSVVNVGEHLK